MNERQSAKVEMLGKALMCISMDWSRAVYARNGEKVYEGSFYFTAGNGQQAWTLCGHSNGLLTISHGDTRKTLGFINEYSTAPNNVMEQAEGLDKTVRKFLWDLGK